MLARPLSNSLPEWRAWLRPARRQLFFLIILGLLATGWVVTQIAPSTDWSTLPAGSFTENKLDERLQNAAVSALGDRRGTIVIMDPQTGRIRAVVNPKLAFEENIPAGSTIKPFTALAALRTGVVHEDSRMLCREKYSHKEFHTTCSHPRDLSPLNPTEAIAYSCNYYFGKVGEQLKEAVFNSTLTEFGFGRKSGVNAEFEAQGKLPGNSWQSQNAIGETENLQATPIQIINAYAALVNGGNLFVPQVAPAEGFTANRRESISIDGGQRSLIIKGLRGAIRYGTAETASLYSLPNYIFGKTGTATEIGGFRTQGWFVGFAANSNAGTGEPEPGSNISIAVLVFLTRAHGSDAAQVAKPIFNEYARFSEDSENTNHVFASTNEKHSRVAVSSSPALQPSGPIVIRVHQVNENVTHTVGLEQYLRGVVAAEDNAETEVEALKALAIASRTYALRNLGRHSGDGYDFCSTTHCQRYRPVDSQTTQQPDAATIHAVNSTSGEVLWDASHQIADAYFSASCGGATANIARLWGGSAPPHLRGVSDEYCTAAAHGNWTDVISREDLLRALQSDPRTQVGETLRNVSILRRDDSKRAELISVEGDRRLIVKGWDFKIIVGRVLGWNVLKSSRFEITRAGSNFVFRGSGFGHGLGLCQEGAHMMAARGANNRQILAKYFPSTRIVKEKGFASSLIWDSVPAINNVLQPRPKRAPRASRQTLSSENFRISYPSTISPREIESLLAQLQSFRRSLTRRVATAGLNARLPVVEIFVNETTGDFVGRTGQPPWAAAATKDYRIEVQPLPTLKRRRILETALRHELVHTLVDSLGRSRTPRWLAEGLAIHLAGEGPLIGRHQPRSRMNVEQIEKLITAARSAEEMRIAYAAAYSEVRNLINTEGEVNLWRRVANSR